MNKVVAVLGFLFLAACTSYRQPLCHGANRVDVPNLEGRFNLTFSFVEADRSRTIRETVVVVRQSRGHYLAHKSSGELPLSTCQIDGLIYAEVSGKEASAPAEAFTAFILQKNGNSSFDLVFLGADSEVLKSRGVPFQIIQVESSGTDPIPRTDPVQNNVLLIDNSNLEDSEFVQMLDPVSIKMTWVSAPDSP